MLLSLNLLKVNLASTNGHSTYYTYYRPSLVASTCCLKLRSGLYPSTGTVRYGELPNLFFFFFLCTVKLICLSFIFRCLALNDTILDYEGSCHYISTQNETLPCQQWEYEQTYYSTTIVTQVSYSKNID